MSAPEGRDAPLEQEEAIERIEELVDDDRNLQSVVYTGGTTEYAHIYLAAVTGTYNGNAMLWVRYVWLSKPGAFESDMWGENGMSMRMVPGMAEAVIPALVRACNNVGKEPYSSVEGEEPLYKDATQEA